jgi:WD40 repeat protein
MANHTSSVVRLIQINQDQVASASGDNTIIVWDKQTGSVVNQYWAHTSAVKDMCILPSGLLASGANDLTMRIWDMQSNTLTTFNLPAAFQSLIFNPLIGDSGALVVSLANSISFYDAVNFSLILNFTTTRTYNGIEILQSSGNVFAGGSSLDVYDSSGNLIYRNTSSCGTLSKVKLMPDNLTVVMGFASGDLQLFNATESTSFFNPMDNTTTIIINYVLQNSAITAHSSKVSILELTPDLLYFVSGGLGGNLVMWTWSTMSLTRKKTFTIPNSIYSAVIIPTTFTNSKTFTGDVFCFFIFLKYLAFNRINRLENANN